MLIVVLAAGAVGVAAGHTPTAPGHHSAWGATEDFRWAPRTCGTCDLDTATRRGQAFTPLIWLLQAAVQALATLAIAGYTGLIRKIT